MTKTSTLDSTEHDEGRLYEQEYLALGTTEMLSEMMNDKGFSKADLARLLGTSRAYVTNLLSGRANPTVRTLADVAAAMGFRVELDYRPVARIEYEEPPTAEHKPTPLTWSQENDNEWAGSEHILFAAA